MRLVLRLFPVLAIVALLPQVVPAQTLTGALVGGVRDVQGGLLPGAIVRVSSPALIGREQSATSGLQASSGPAAAGEQLSTLTSSGVFGRDPNDLHNARGRLVNDRPHMFRTMGSVDVPRTGLVVAGNLRYFSGKPWAASTQVSLPQGNRRVLLEPSGSRRLSSQSLVDLRVSKTFRFGNMQRLELMMDLLNVFNDTAEEALVTDKRFSPTFGQPNVFMNPRRVMLGARLDVGR